MKYHYRMGVVAAVATAVALTAPPAMAQTKAASGPA